MNDREIVRSNPNASDYMDNFHINSHKNVLLLFEKTENNGKEAADGSYTYQRASSPVWPDC